MKMKMKWCLLFVAVFQIQLLTIHGQPVPAEPQSGAETQPKIEKIPYEGLPRSCKRIKQSNPNAPSKMYTIAVGSSSFALQKPKTIDVYCEMGLNGGGYTFLSPESILELQTSDLAAIFTDKTSFLLRVRMTDGSQTYAVLKQLTRYEDIPLKLGLSENSGYNPPVNNYTGTLAGQPFLYFGFLPIQYAANNNIQGLQVNGFNNEFTNCDANPNSYFAIFPNFPEAAPSPYHVPGPVCQLTFAHLLPNPAGRVMPPELFMFAEVHFGGCGFYKQTNQADGALSINIGVR